MKRSSKLLFTSPPIVIQREAAEAFGPNLAVLLQQIHYWCFAAEGSQNQRYFADGEYWAVFSFDGWLEQLSWLSMSTIQRLILKAEKEGLVITRHEHQIKWLRINYEGLEKRELTPEEERYTGDF